MADNQLTTTQSKLSTEKADIQELEAYPKTDLSWADKPDDDDETSAPGILGYFLKKNPSPTFIGDVARMNTYDLDPVVIKRLEKKVDLLIIPALAVCYMVSGSIIDMGANAYAFSVLLCVRGVPGLASRY